MADGYRFPALKWLMSFEAAARHLSFTAAAEELGLTQAAISYQIRMLESQVGFPLFERRPRHLRLTDMGHAYLPSVRKAFDELFASTTGLFGPIGERSVTIRVAVSFAVLCLAPRLKDFQARYPAIKVRVWSSIWANAIQSTEADFDIRFGAGKWPDYDATLLTPEQAVVVCSPNFAAGLAPSTGLGDLPAEQMISVAGQDDLWMRARAEGGAAAPLGGGFKVDTSLASAELAASGIGCAILLRRFAMPYLRAGRLVTPFTLDLGLSRSHYLLMPIGRERPRPEVLLLRDWLLALDWDEEAQDSASAS
ncbi:MAG: LysR substrate-binding domain-containing protein [Pseudomonadota bacterium]